MEIKIRKWTRFMPTNPNKHYTMSLIGMTKLSGFGTSKDGIGADAAREVNGELRRRAR
jgi:hypothetical protein